MTRFFGQISVLFDSEATKGAQARLEEEGDACGNPRFLAGDRIANVCCGKEIPKRKKRGELLLCQCRHREYSKFQFEDTGPKRESERDQEKACEKAAKSSANKSKEGWRRATEIKREGPRLNRQRNSEQQREKEAE